MFSIANLMHPYGQQRNHSNMSVPCFFELQPQSNCCRTRCSPQRSNLNSSFGNRPAHNRCEIPDGDQSGRIYFPFENVLQHIFENRMNDQPEEQRKRKEEMSETVNANTRNTTQRKCKSDTPSATKNNENKSQREMDPPKPTIQDIMKHALSAFGEWKKDQACDQWRQQIDCRGFESKNIRVKIDSHELLLKAFKKQESEDGVRTMSMRKSVPIPENIDTKKIKCKLSPNGLMIIEAPYLGNRQKENALDFVNGMMATMFPGLEHLLKPDDTSNETPLEDSCSDQCNDRKETIEKPTTNPNTEKSNQQTPIKEDDVSTVDDQESENKTEIVEKEQVGKFQIEEDSDIKSVKKDNDDKNKKEEYEPRVDNVETESNASEDSFVLLSEMEKESCDENSTKTTDGHDVNDKNDDVARVDTVLGDCNIDVSEPNDNVIFKADKDDQTIVSSDSRNETKEFCDENKHEDNNSKVLFRLEMPSYNPESMKVTFDSRTKVLSIYASKDQTSSEGMTSPETTTKKVTVDDDVDVNGLQCYFRDGALTVVAPLKPTIRVIPINSSDS